MLKRVVIGAAAAAFLGGAAFAQAPANEDECFQQLQDIESAAIDRNLPDADRIKVDDLLDKLEAQCGAGEFPQAGQTIGDINKIMQ